MIQSPTRPGKTCHAGRRLDPRLHHALVSAMRGALRRSTVLLPVSEDEDLLQRFIESALGAEPLTN